MIVTEELDILWRCSELNDSFHDRQNLGASRFASRGIQLLENRSEISEKDLKLSYWDEMEGFNTNRNAHCPILKCYYREIHRIVLGIFGFINLIILITIFRV